MVTQLSIYDKDGWNANKLYNTDPDVDGTLYCCRGGFLDSVYSYDASFSGISPHEAQAIDPTQHLMLELCWKGFERPGYLEGQLSGGTLGVFLNNGARYRVFIDASGHAPDL